MPSTSSGVAARENDSSFTGVVCPKEGGVAGEEFSREMFSMRLNAQWGEGTRILPLEGLGEEMVLTDGD